MIICCSLTTFSASPERFLHSLHCRGDLGEWNADGKCARIFIKLRLAIHFYAGLHLKSDAKLARIVVLTRLFAHNIWLPSNSSEHTPADTGNVTENNAMNNKLGFHWVILLAL